MAKRENKTPTIQVLERAFGLLDVLASYPDPVRPAPRSMRSTTGMVIIFGWVIRTNRLRN